MDVVEPSGRKSVLFSMLLTPTEYAGLYFSYHGTFVWDPYRKMNGINLINHRVAAWCRYTPTSRMGRFEVVKATTRDKPNFPDIKVGIGFILASGKVYSRKYANFEIRLGKYAEFLRKTYEPGDWIRFKAIYHEEFYKITHIYDNRPLMKIKMETAETKIGTAYLLTKMKRHPIMFDVFCSDTIGLVEDPDGTYSTFIKKKFREVFRAAAKLLKNKNVFNPRAPEFPRIPKSEDESIQRQLDEYTRWWKTQPERYNWIDPEKHLNHNLFPYFNYRNGVSYSVTHRHLFDDNWYNVWCIENPDPYGSPLCVCPWEHLPLEKLFSGDDYNIPKVLVEHAINERHKKDDFRRIQIGAPRDQEAERNEAVVSVMNDLETTSLADYYLKKFTDQGNLLDHQ
uniref:Uncharacterized protein n=1 Tax=Acrobeloides nanus TaxID=290746 RepID=A0A914EN77_9BILA